MPKIVGETFPGPHGLQGASSFEIRTSRKTSRIGRSRILRVFDPPSTALADDVGHNVHNNIGFAIKDHNAGADYAALIVGRKRRQLPRDFDWARLHLFL